MKNLVSVKLSNEAVNNLIPIGTLKNPVYEAVADQILIGGNKIGIPQSLYNELEILSNFFQCIKNNN